MSYEQTFIIWFVCCGVFFPVKMPDIFFAGYMVPLTFQNPGRRWNLVVRKGKEIERMYGMKVCNPVEFAEEEKWQQSRRR